MFLLHTSKEIGKLYEIRRPTQGSAAFREDAGGSSGLAAANVVDLSMAIHPRSVGKRRDRFWLWGLLVIPIGVLILGGAVGWSWFQPVELHLFGTELLFGRYEGEYYGTKLSSWQLRSGYAVQKLSGGKDASYYTVAWNW